MKCVLRYILSNANPCRIQNFCNNRYLGFSVCRRNEAPVPSDLRQLVCKESSNRPTSKSEFVTDSKVVKVAIIGLPNAGKSTVINNLLNRKVCPISSKVHTTRNKIRAIGIEGNTQIIFLDTPGLVTADESKRFKLECTFLQDGEQSIGEADLVGVVHDVSNKYYRDTLDTKVLRLLYLNPSKPSFLIINKIDLVTSKYKMLKIIRKLSGGTVIPENTIPKLSELQILKETEDQHGWPYFSEVFLVSALTGSGMADIKQYIISKARSAPWLYPNYKFTDEPPEGLIEKTVRSCLLENLPQEIPYLLRVQVEHLHESESGKLVCVVMIECPRIRYQNIVLGRRGSKIRYIAQKAEQELFQIFQQPFYLKIVVQPAVPASEKK